MSEFNWQVCVMCGPMIVCAKCGMNTCSSGYGEVDGVECDQCPINYAEYQAAYAENRVPVLPGGSIEERKKALGENRRRLEAEGVRFATAEDFKMFGLGEDP